MPLPVEIRVVLFDLGGVLTVDPWQTLILTPMRGIADRLSIDRDRAAEVAERLWERDVVRADADQRDYWRSFGEAVEVRIPAALVESVEQELLRANPEAARVLAALAADGRRIGIVSDNTRFWFEHQARIVGLDRAADADLRFLSFERGVTKNDVPGLLELAAEAMPPSSALVVDDREEHVARARSLGLHARHYPPTWQDSLVRTVMER